MVCLINYELNSLSCWMGNSALSLEFTSSKHFNVVNWERSCIFGEPVIDVKMMLDRTISNSINAALTEVFSGPVSTIWTRTSSETAISCSSICLRHFESNMSLTQIIWLESYLMTFSCPVMSQTVRHIFQSIEFNILNPLVVLHGINPERSPIVVVITCHLVIKFKLQETVSTNWEVACILSVLIDAGISVYSFTSDSGGNWTWGLGDVWSLQEFSIFPASITGTTIVIMGVETSCKGTGEV